MLQRARSAAGFSLIEMVTAMAIFAMVATSMATVLTGATYSDGLSRQRAIALELGQQEVEYIRQLDYTAAGTVAGNPSGTILPTQQKQIRGLWYTISTRIRFVNDPIPTSFATYANYKQIRVTVTRASDSKRLARIYSYMSSATREDYGGVDNAIINVLVQDFALHTPLQNVTVSLYDGPLSYEPASDVTDETGVVNFAGLEPNPTSGSDKYYDILVPNSGGYWQVREDLPPMAVPPGDSNVAEAPPSHIVLSASETANETIRLYLGATIDIFVKDSAGNPYSGTATVTVGGPGPYRATQQVSVTGGHLATPLTTLGPGACPPVMASSTCEYIVPGVPYTVGAQTADKHFAAAVVKTVPDNYPSVLSSTFTLTLGASALTTYQCQITVKKGGSNVSGARVDLIDGPGGPVASYQTATTNSSGVATFAAVPSGLDYDIKAWSGVATGTLTDKSVASGCAYTVNIS